jgi:hypothetical protein
VPFFVCLTGSIIYSDTTLTFMHIEKNVCENIYGTLLEMEEKLKDNLQARKDLQEINIRSDLHPEKSLMISITCLQLCITCLKRKRNSYVRFYMI